MREPLSTPPIADFYPPGLPRDKQYEALSLPQMFERSVKLYGPQICTDFMGRKLTYSQLGQRVDKTARGLAALGIGKNSMVGLMLPNSPTYVIFYFAILKTGASVVNFNPLYSLHELEVQIRDSGTQLMITHDLAMMFDKLEALLASNVLKQAVIARFAALLPQFKSLAFRLLKRRDIADWKGSGVRAQLIDEADLLANDGAPLAVAIDPYNDLAVLQYTGGTTGTPKGAMLSHANLNINVQQLQDWAPSLIPGQERVMGILPFFHVFAMTTILNFGIAHGAQMILVPKFELEQALKLIDRKKPTMLPGVPTLYTALLSHPEIEKYDLSSLKFCISGGAGLPVKIRQQFEKIAGCSLIEGYGLSETSPVATANPVEGAVREGSIGVPLAATHISIRSIDDPSLEVALGEQGEICIRGPQVMQGYWQRPGENAKLFVDGYFRTGDIGYIAKDGFIYIVDRLKDMIIASGFKIYPRQVEEAIYKIAQVEEVTVIGIADDYRGEAPKAFIKLKKGQKISKGEIMAFLEKEISKLELPAQIEFRDELPKTMIGKLSRKELRKEA